MPTMNAKHEIEALFKHQTRGSNAAVGGILKDVAVPKVSLVIGADTKDNIPLKFPLVDPTSVSMIKEHGSIAKLSINGREAIDLDLRNSYQLLPHQIRLEGLTNQPAFSSLLTRIQHDLCLRNPLEAYFYKFLLYEVGSFFRKHRDHERLPNTIGTLIIELPSTYSGGDLLVWSHDDPEPISFSTQSDCELGFSAFFVDCPHEVTEVTEGNRCALVFTLTTTELLETPSSTSIVPLQYAEGLVKQMKRWSIEGNMHYSHEHDSRIPEKLAIFLNHSYTRAGITGGGDTWVSMRALKGNDRNILELVIAATKVHDSDFDAFLSLLCPSSQLDERVQWETSPGPVIQFLQGREVPTRSGIASWVTGANQMKMPLYARDIIVTSSKNEVVHESCGNYNRAAVILWPRSHLWGVGRELVEWQTKGSTEGEEDEDPWAEDIGVPGVDWNVSQPALEDGAFSGRDGDDGDY